MNLSGFSRPVPFALDRQDVFNDFDIDEMCAVYLIIKDDEIVKIGESCNLKKRLSNYLNTNKSEEGPKRVTRRNFRTELRNNTASNYTVRWKKQANKNESEKAEQELLYEFKDENNGNLPILNKINR